MRCEGFDIMGELSQVDVSDLLPERGTIGRYTLTKDAYGGRTATWPVTAAAVACAVVTDKPFSPERVGERLADHRMSYKIKVGLTTTLNPKDRITIDGVVYDIQGEQEHDTFGLFHMYWAQIVSDPQEATP